MIHKYIIKFYLLLIRHFKSIKYFAKVLPLPEPIIGKCFTLFTPHCSLIWHFIDAMTLVRFILLLAEEGESQG